MRLIRYINEQDDTTILGDPLLGKGDKGSTEFDYMDDILNEYIPKIKRDCKEMVKIVKATKSFLWRGMAGDDEVFLIKTPRKDRYPTDTPIKTQEIFDKLYYEKYGWKPRTEGVFVSNNERGTTGYGPKHVIFPVGKFKYAWAMDINDFWIYVRRLTRIASTDEQIEAHLKDDAIKKYNNNKGIDKFMKKKVPGEMMIKCKKYYAINYELVEWATIANPGFESEFQDMFFK